jgi:hypothetical protein
MSPMISETEPNERLRFLLYGNIGSGKTTLLRTLPGKKFIYMFDPAGRCSLEQSDNVWIEEFLPDNLPINVSSIKGIVSSTTDNSKYEIYKLWEADFNKRILENWFKENGINAICFDSLTTFGDIILDQILAISGRLGKSPEISDYGMQANAITRVVRLATSQDAIVCFTGHEKSQQDKLLRTISMQLIVPGQLAAKLPILFSDIYHCKVEREGNAKPKYIIETVPSELFPSARCSLHLPPVVDVTIPEGVKDIEAYGLGKILKEKGRTTTTK